MPQDLDTTLAEIRRAILDRDALVRVVGAGRRKGRTPDWRKVEVRPVDLKSGPRTQVVRYDATQAHTSNYAADELEPVVAELLAQPFGNWHVETTAATTQVRVTKKGEAMVHTTAASPRADEASARAHDRAKRHVLPADDPLFVALGISDADGRLKPSREAKFRQVDQLLRALGHGIDEARAAGALPPADGVRPLRIVDLGCGNGYLTFAAHRYLMSVRGETVEVLGVDAKEQSLRHNTDVARSLGVDAETRFLEGTIDGVRLEPAPDVVLALHACDTATDDALARAVEWGSGLVLAAPCCHHDLARQLRSAKPPVGYATMLQNGILRERLADTLTDTVRALALRGQGYRVDVVDFVESKHTPRNTLLRAVRTGATPAAADLDLTVLTETWGVRPAILDRLNAAPVS